VQKDLIELEIHQLRVWISFDMLIFKLQLFDHKS